MSVDQGAESAAPAPVLDEIGFGAARRVGRNRFRLARLHVRLSGALELDEQSNRIGHAVADREQAVVPKNHRAVGTDRFGDPLASVDTLNLNLFVIE